ncbi:zinc finger SWIM domain-containing protein 7-like [Liolophura sinensis]|uniref:zinc finger SWIM domain-containing protein 7-like n=1 Tax=Liolophura sinensis TaxID=3198878 RepID=UPI0031584AD2
MTENSNAGEKIWQTAEQLLEEVRRVYTQNGSLTDELLSALNFVFQAPLLPALDLVDNSHVTRLVSPSGRCLFQVVGSSGTPYVCLPSSIYCACPAFKFSVLKKNDHIMCKHVLAVKLSEAMGKTQRYDVSDREITNLLTHLD